MATTASLAHLLVGGRGMANPLVGGQGPGKGYPYAGLVWTSAHLLVGGQGVATVVLLTAEARQGQVTAHLSVEMVQIPAHLLVRGQGMATTALSVHPSNGGRALVDPFQTLIACNLNSGRLGGFLTYNT